MKTFLFVAMLAISLQAHGGENYVVVGVGQSRFVGNGLWYNFDPIHTYYGFEWRAEEKSTVWHIGVGRTFAWGAAEFVYQDFGETTSFAGYPIDPADSPSTCNYPCTPTQWAHHRGTAKGYSISVLPEWKFPEQNAALFARVGMTLYRATFEYSIANVYGNAYATQFDDSKSYKHWGISPLYGVGVRVGGFTLEAAQHKSIEAKNSENSTGSWLGINTLSVSYRIPFK